MVIVTAAPHRGDAYEANRYVIEAIKDRLPIWKLERFADGSRWKRPGPRMGRWTASTASRRGGA